MTYISCTDLSIGYEKKSVCTHIDFSINETDYTCIVGENGAGKSTLMKTVLKLIPPVAGEIIRYVEAVDVGYLPQQTIVQKDFPASVYEVVMSGNMTKSPYKFFYNQVDKDRARQNMEKLSIWELKNKSYKALSGGQQQRVLLARALCASEKLLFLDEPVSGLDPKVTQDFYALLADLNKEGLTVVMVSHDIKAACNYAKQILHLGRKQLFYGDCEDYIQTDLYNVFTRTEN